MGLLYGFSHLSICHVNLFLSVRFIVMFPFRAQLLKWRSLLLTSFLLWIMSGLFAFTYYYLRFEIHCNAVVLVLTMRVYLLSVPVFIIVILHVIKVRLIRKAARRHERHRNPSKRMSILTSLIVGIYISAAFLYPMCFVFTVKQYPSYRSFLLVARYMWLIIASANPVVYFLHYPPIYNSIRRQLGSMRSYFSTGEE